MATQEILTTFQLKRGTAARWQEVNPILAPGEPGTELDTGKLKIGNGFDSWKQLSYVGSAGIVSADTKADFPAIGDVNIIYKASAEKSLYQWNSTTSAYELLSSGEVDIDDLLDEKESIKYEVFSKPINTLVKYHSGEIRIMCPKDTDWKLQQSGNNADPFSYYIGFKAYAPKGAESFKEDLAEIISDDTMYYFTNNDFAGIDETGRKYSIVWLPVARNEEGSWTYYGSISTHKKYIGWHYSAEWYNAAGQIISADNIRINLSNESCHNIVEPYFMGSIDINKLSQKEGDYLILYGGSATDNI